MRLIREKICPPVNETTGKRPPSTFLFWIVGIYIALFGIASQRYENRLDVIEARLNSIITQAAINENRRKALERIPKAQGLALPAKPELIFPWMTIYSLFVEKTHGDSIETLKGIIESFATDKDKKGTFKDLNLKGANLINADLRGAFLKEAILIGADLSGADLSGADLKEAILKEAILKEAILIGADLSGADLREADLRETDLRSADLIEAVLSGAILREAVLSFANLREALLIGADLSGADLSGADLSGADLSGAIWINGKKCKSDSKKGECDFEN